MMTTQRPLVFRKSRRAEWQAWWKGLSPWERSWPALSILLYVLGLAVFGALRSDHWLLCGVLMLLSYFGRRGREAFLFFLPVVLTGAIYDSMRWYADALRGPVHVAEPYELEKRLFGIKAAEEVLTPNEWWRTRTHVLLDLVCGFAYMAFVPVFLLICAAFRFVLSRQGTTRFSALQLERSAPALTWSFLAVNLLGYSTYYIYPAAPPWYVELYGLGPARMDVLPNAAGCVRFDALIGFPYFQEFYSRSADVFGAIPSLHVSYPWLAVHFSFRFGALQAVSVIFYLVMCFSAVYLNHHYIVDVLAGTLYAAVVAAAFDQLYVKRRAREARV